MPWTWKSNDNEVRIYNNGGAPVVHFSTDDLPSVMQQLTTCMQINEERMKIIKKLQEEIKQIRNETLEECAKILDEGGNGLDCYWSLPQVAKKIRELKIL